MIKRDQKKYKKTSKTILFMIFTQDTLAYVTKVSEKIVKNIDFYPFFV